MIVIANPGTHPELTHLAEGLARSGDLRYLTSASWARDSAPMRLASLAPRSRASRTFRRRALPPAVRADQVVRVAGLREVAFQVARSRGMRVGDRLMFALNRRFQEQAGRHIRRLAPDVLVAQYTAAKELFEVPGDHLRVLNHPIVHHAWMTQQERLEEADNPEWAPFLRGSHSPEAVLQEMRERMDAEIAVADAVLVPSEFVRRTFVDSGVDPAKLLVSNLGADLPQVADRGPARDDRPLQVVYAGQVTQRKGISYLLEAVQRVPQVELTVMGHPTAGIEPMIARYPRVRMLRSGTRPELFEQFQAADLLALPSLAEGFPLVAIEAMANGLAPVLTDAAAADDLVEDGVSGYRVRARSVDDLVRVLQQAAGDRAAVAGAGRAARARAERFTWAAYEQRTIAMLHDLVVDRAARA